MKIRNGFVSNSSSSSFCVIVSKEHHEEAMKAVHPFIKACMEALGSDNSKFNGQDVVSIGYLSVMDSNPWEYITVDYDGELPKGEYGEIDRYESLDEYIKKVKELFGEEAMMSVSFDG